MKYLIIDFNNVLYKPKEKSIDKELMTYLIDIQKRGYPLVLFTNTPQLVLNSINNKYQFMDNFYKVISCDNCNKTEQIAYKRLIRELDCKSTDLMFIDDNNKNIQTAKEVGIVGIQYTDLQNLRPILNKLIY